MQNLYNKEYIINPKSPNLKSNYNFYDYNIYNYYSKKIIYESKKIIINNKWKAIHTDLMDLTVHTSK